MGKGKKIIFYFSYTIAALVFFLYFLFPSEAVKRYVSDNFTFNPEFSMDIEKIAPTIPFGLALHNLDLSHNDSQIIRFPVVKISPKVMSLFTSEKIINFKGKLYNGIVKGVSKTIEDRSLKSSDIEVYLTDIRIEKIEALKHLEKYRLSGRLDGTILLDEPKRQGRDVKAEFSISKGQTRIVPSVLGIDQIDMDRIEADMLFSGNRLRLKSCTLKGPQFDGRMSGTIQFKQPLEKSRLNFSGILKPHPDFIARIQSQLPEGLLNSQNLVMMGQSFRIAGTLDDPQYSIR